ncbi:putative phospholipase B-like 2 [Brachionichthys hirsutus]|uniref:putative phospholipase B-like 2 n=1 Tax=Brachionichthys hirsutus TaxID=412623 RepID=UPI00360531F7
MASRRSKLVKAGAPPKFLNLLAVLTGLLFVCVSVRADIRSAVLDKPTGTLSVVEGYRADFVAWVNFTDDIKKSGWSFLEVTTSGRYNDSIQAYAAGAVEAAVTAQLIYKHWMNTLVGYCGPFTSKTGYCDRLKVYITKNLQWVQAQMETQRNSPYWHQVRLTLLQLKGLEDSYNDELSFPLGSFSVNPFGFILFQLGGDLEDLESALNKSLKTRPVGSGSCSALIKLLPNNEDLFVSHDTWNSYSAMLRIMKKYTFAFKVSPLDNDPLPGGVQAFSSYPGTIFSGDDFYIIGSGLVTLETTIGNSNPDLWKYVTPTGTVFEWLRNIVANRLATTGKEWAELFSKYNSGTYNNQWMIVDYNHFTPGKTIREDLFVVLEQIPGDIVYTDRTQELMEKGYWASYNIPYYVEIFNASGCNELVEKYGSWFSLEQNPRAQIFRRNQTAIKDVDSMIRLMRYNNFKEDPLSKCDGCDPPANAENAISARSDLNSANGTYPFGALRQRSHGGTDMKMTSYRMYRDYSMMAVSGPTWDQVPPFQWSTSPYEDLLHMGQPDIWAFKPIKVTWTP